MTTDTEKRLAEIRERAEKATKGPLHAVKQPQILGGEYEVRIQNGMEIAFVTKLEDATLFSASVDDIPFLLAEIERLSADYKTCSGKFWDLQQRYADVNNQFTEAQSTIDRLTAERGAAWVAGRDAAAQVADEYAGRMKSAYDKQVAAMRTGTVPACKADAGESIAAAIRALSPSTLNKPE